MRVGRPLYRREVNAAPGQFFGQCFGALPRCFAYQRMPVTVANIRSNLFADAFEHPRNPFVGKTLYAHLQNPPMGGPPDEVGARPGGPLPNIEMLDRAWWEGGQRARRLNDIGRSRAVNPHFSLT
jgi:hypothetical protein